MVSIFKRVNWSRRSLIIGQFDFIIICPIFVCLLKKILTLYFWMFIITIVIFPVILIFVVVGEFRKLLSMNTQNLISKFISHIINHFFNPFFLNRSQIFTFSIQTFKCQSQNTIFTIFNSFLSVNMSIKILFHFFKFAKHCCFSSILKIQVCFFNILQSRVRKFFHVDVNVIKFEPT